MLSSQLSQASPPNASYQALDDNMPAEIHLLSPHLAIAPSTTRHSLIYFLTGNPGLIDYYVPFLAHLRTRLDAIEAAHNHKVTHHIYGRDLAGFNEADHRVPFNTTDNPPFNVEAQIQHSLKHLQAANAIPTGAAGTRAGEAFDEVILIGHSFGTYVALELFHRHLHDPEGFAPRLRLRTGVLLFATIAHIGRSPKGVQLDLLRRTPVLGAHAHAIARTALRVVPSSLLRWVLRTVLRMPPHAEDATARFLESRDGVHQALHLGMDEMAVITEAGWAEELWEIADEAEAHHREVPKFFILFGKKDHWVASEYRDRFIREREEHAAREGVPGHKRGKTRIVVEEDGLPHDFCLSKCETPSLPQPCETTCVKERCMIVD